MVDLGFIKSHRTIAEWLQRQEICVTGGQGALGRRLVRRLVASGAHSIRVFDQKPPGLCSGTAEAIPVEKITGDILNQSDLARALQECTIVFHLAALVHVGRSQSEPVRYFKVNALGTAFVLEACRRLGIRRVIYVSTSHVYGIPNRLPVTEEHATVPISVYAATKLAGEIVIQGYANSYDFSCDIARLSNLYGASLGTETVIGCALNQIASGKPITLCNLAAVRDFIHADDVIEALIQLAVAGDGLTGCRIVNVSTGQGVSVQKMARILVGVGMEYGLKTQEVIQTGLSPNELVPKLILKNDRLRELTGWSPEIDLKKGLRLAMKELLSQGWSKSNVGCNKA